MKNIVFLVVFSIFATLYSSDSSKSSEWKLKKDHERFQVYVRENSGSKIDEVQVIALISGTIKEAYDVLIDVGNFPQTFGPHVIRSEIVKKGVDCNNVYIVMDPPVLEKRATHIKLCTTYNSLNSFGFYWTNIPNTPSDKDEKSVTMNFNTGGCTFAETSAPDELQVTCQAALDLGGSLPVFAINEINTKAIPSVIWQIYDEIQRRRDFSTELFNSHPEEKKNSGKKGK